MDKKELEETRGKLFTEFEKECGWIGGTKRLYTSFDPGMRRIWRKKNPVIMTSNPTYENYWLYTYVVFGVRDDVSGSSPLSFLKRHGDASPILAPHRAEVFNEKKIESIKRVISACQEVGNMKLIDAPVVGDWLKKMVDRKSRTLNRLASFTVKKFMNMFKYRDCYYYGENGDLYRNRNYDALAYERYRRAIEDYVNIKNTENLTDEEFDEYMQSLYYFSMQVPIVHNVITEELAKLLKTEIEIRDEKIPAVLKGYWCD